MSAIRQHARDTWSALRHFLDGFLGLNVRGVAGSTGAEQDCPESIRAALAERASTRKSCC